MNRKNALSAAGENDDDDDDEPDGCVDAARLWCRRQARVQFRSTRRSSAASVAAEASSSRGSRRHRPRHYRRTKSSRAALFAQLLWPLALFAGERPETLIGTLFVPRCAACRPSVPLRRLLRRHLSVHAEHDQRHRQHSGGESRREGGPNAHRHRHVHRAHHVPILRHPLPHGPQRRVSIRCGRSGGGWRAAAAPWGWVASAAGAAARGVCLSTLPSWGLAPLLPPPAGSERSPHVRRRQQEHPARHSDVPRSGLHG